MGPARWTEKYLEIPFVDPGWSIKGCHCWGLIYLVFKQEHEIELPKYGELSAAKLRDAAKMISTMRHEDPWVPVIGVWRPFDVIVIACDNENRNATYEERRRKIPGHVGVASSHEDVLHIEEGIHSTNMHRDHVRLRGRIIEAYRHKALA